MNMTNNTPDTDNAQSPLRKFLARRKGATVSETENAPAPAPSVQEAPVAESKPSKGGNGALRAVANTLSGIFSPLFVPTFAVILAFWVTPLAHAPERARLTSAAVVFLVTAIVPLGVIIGLIRLGKVTDLAIDDRRQRTIPFAVSVACYLAAAVYLRMCQAPAWLWLFFVAAAVAALCALFISFRWKISAHSLGMGGMCGMVIWLALHRLAGEDATTLIIILTVLSGAVASARVYLGRHTPAQTYAGWLLALFLALVIMSFSS